MKRTWLIVGTLAVLAAGVVTVAEARGFGPGAGYQVADTTRPFTYGPGGMGRQGMGWQGEFDREAMMAQRGTMGRQGMIGQRGMMGQPGVMGRQGMLGRQGMMGQNADTCDGENYDPKAMAERIEQALEQHETVLANLKAQLETATEAQKTFLTQRIEMQTIMGDWQKGKLPIVQGLTEEWPAGAIKLAEYDKQFFAATKSDDSVVQAWIANRLEAAQQRIENLEEQSAEQSN